MTKKVFIILVYDTYNKTHWIFNNHYYESLNQCNVVIDKNKKYRKLNNFFELKYKVQIIKEGN